MEEFEAELMGGHLEDAVEVPFNPLVEWGISAQKIRSGRNGYHVLASVNGTRFRSYIVPRMKKFFLTVDEDTKAAANVSTGDRVTVTVEPLAAPGAADG